MSLVRGVLIALGVVFLLIIWGLFAVCNDDDDHNNSLGPNRVTLVAYHGGDGDGYDYDEGCGRDGGGCNNRRREDYSGSCAKYNCQNFDKSPVDHAFNFSPFICMPGATCTAPDDRNKEREQEPAR